ncbi:hypothetical protein EDC04DRAFT_2599167 [Pisolithus marmoratus]|nr:hypothetical protein EDC04DRAFT_2599167 [Pisolithus marmoratus]
MDTYWREDVPPRWTQNHNGPSDSQMTVLQQQHKATGWDSEHTWFEQHGTPVLPWDVPRKDAGSDNRLNSSAICSHRTEKKLLANNGGWCTKHEVKQPNNLPALPKPPPTGIPHLPRP